MSFPHYYNNGPPLVNNANVYTVDTGDMNHDLTQNLNQYTPIEVEDQKVNTRGEAWSELISCLTCPLLRLGFLTQLLVLMFGYSFYYGYGGTGVFTFDVLKLPEELKNSETFNMIVIVLEIIFLVGCMFISGFQIYVADNSVFSRGFRAGSRMLSTAATLDTLVIGLRLMQSIYAYQFLGIRWWLKYTLSSTDWCVFYFTTFIHALALFLYGFAIFYMESYHDEGTYEEWAWIVLILFSVSGLFEFFLCFASFGNFYTAIHMIAVFAAVIWSFSFEPLLHYYSPVFHDRNPESNMQICSNPDKQAESA